MSDDEDELTGNYKVLGTLGEGGFGKVRLALHATNGEVAIKTIEKIPMPPDEIVTVPEARHMMRLKHPHILKLFEVVDTEEHLHLVMEYAPRGDLCAYLMEAGKLSESAARAWFRQLVSAVQYCHQKNVVHLDIKLQNILVDGQKNIKLADFGLSERFTPGLRLDKFCGTPEYAAPEIKKQQKYHGPPADVWSLGVVLYSMITGRLPFDAATSQKLSLLVQQGHFLIPYHVSFECEDLLKKCLVTKPSKRATLEAIMRDTWLNMEYQGKELEPYVEGSLELQANYFSC